MSDMDWTNQEMGPQSVMEEPDDLTDYYFTPVLPNQPVMEEPDDLSDYYFHPSAQGCKKIPVLGLHHAPPLYWRGTQQAVDRRMRKRPVPLRSNGRLQPQLINLRHQCTVRLLRLRQLT